jgi:hypothetical protein
MKSAAFPYLPMHAGRSRVIAMHPVNAQIVFAGRCGTLGINERERIKKAAVLRPKLDERYSG